VFDAIVESYADLREVSELEVGDLVVLWEQPDDYGLALVIAKGCYCVCLTDEGNLKKFQMFPRDRVLSKRSKK
jgi:hypothetical protein